MSTVLLLGGTAEAREIARLLEPRSDLTVVSSLAGRVSNPALPVGEVRIGGFGGVEGLVAWLSEHDAVAVIDATHPFAEGISANAVAACQKSGVPLLRVQRPGWHEGPGDRWTWVDDLDEAAGIAARFSHPFITSGRQGLPAFAALEVPVVIRCVEPPDCELPNRSTVILDRGPYSLDGERELMVTHEIDVVVTKDSGGDLTRAKLLAARELGIAVIVVRRPQTLATDVIDDTAGVLSWLEGQLG